MAEWIKHPSSKGPSFEFQICRLFSWGRQLAISRIVAARDSVWTYMFLRHSRFQGQGCRSPPPLVCWAPVAMGQVPPLHSCFRHVLKSTIKLESQDRPLYQILQWLVIGPSAPVVLLILVKRRKIYRRASASVGIEMSYKCRCCWSPTLRSRLPPQLN